MKAFLLLSSVLLSITVAALSQEDKIETDRPTEAQAAEVVGKGTFQAEIGIGKQQQGHDFAAQHPEAVLRYGVLKNWELRLHTTAETDKFYSKDDYEYGLMPVEAGLKAALFHNRDTTFSTSLYGLVGLPRLASKSHRHSETFYRVRLLFENALSKNIKLNYNIGRDWDSDQKQQNWMYAVSPQFDLSDKWQAVLEVYGFVQKHGKPEEYMDAGVAYYISKNIKVDLNAGKGLSHEADDYFINTGVSFRL